MQYILFGIALLSYGLKMIKNGLRIFYDDFSEKVKNIHDEMEKHHSYKKKRVADNKRLFFILPSQERQKRQLKFNRI